MEAIHFNVPAGGSTESTCFSIIVNLTLGEVYASLFTA